MDKTKNSRAVPCVDHLGNNFPSIRAMCEYHKISPVLFLYRRAQGWTLEQSLRHPKSREVCDHKGISYPTLTAMCAAYHIPIATVQFRLYSGWSIENALTAPLDNLRQSETTVCIDHLGNKFPSKSVMCAYYGISAQTFTARIKKGMTLKEALTKQVRHHIVA